MSAKIISGTEIRKEILAEIREEVRHMREDHDIVPGLVTILVGESPASMSYVSLKIKTALSLLFQFLSGSTFPEFQQGYMEENEYSLHQS